jgi:hypothetical protein
MTNPYHNPYTGEFCSQGAMRVLMNTALSEGNFEKYSTFRSIIDQAEREKDARIIEGFQAVKSHDIQKIKELVSEKLSDLADSSEEKAILSGWSKNATPETLDLFLENPNFSSTAFASAYENFSEEDKIKFLKENKNLETSKLSYRTNNMVINNFQFTDDVSKGRAKALLEREKVTSEMVITAQRSLGAHATIQKIVNDYASGARTVWPFSRNSTNKGISLSSRKIELSLISEAARGVGNVQRIFFAQKSEHPEVLATLGSSDSIALDSVLDNPHTNAEALAAIIRTNKSMSSAQYEKTVKLLASKPNLPKKVAEGLAQNSKDGEPVFFKPVYTEQEEAILIKEISQSRKMLSSYKKASISNKYKSLSEEDKDYYAKKIQETQAQLTISRAKLDATDRNYDSLIAQKKHLEKSIVLDTPENSSSYKVVVERLAQADSYRQQKDGSDKLQVALMGFGYFINPLNNNRRY